MALRTVGVRLAADVSGYINGMRTARTATRDFTSELDRAARAGKLDAVANQATGMGLALVAGFGYAVNAAAQFDKQMSAVSAATHASAAEMDKLREAALQAGKDTSFSATEAAKGVEELSKAGVSTADVLGGGLNGALALAAAGELDVGDAAETAASAMTQFKLSGKDVPHIADLLAAGAGKAQGSVQDMGAALNQAGLVSAQMGLTIEDTTGTLAAFASAGLIGSDAGTSLKTTLLMLANPTEKAAGLMKDLGIQAYDSQGKFVGISKLAGQLKERLGGLTQEQRNAALATIFGSDAIRAASILYEQGAEGVDKFRKAVDDQGYAAETARMKTDNLVGDLDRLKGSLETLAIESGGGANEGLRVLAKAANAVVDEFGQLDPAVSGGITVLAGLSGVALLVGAGWVRMRRSTADMLDELRKVGPSGTRAARGLEVAGKWAGRATIAFAAFEIAGAAVSAMQEDLNPQVEALGKGLAEWGKSGRLSGEAARVLGKDMQDLGVGFKFLADTDNTRRNWARGMQETFEKLPIGLDGTNTSLTRTTERVQAMDSALAGLVQGGQAEAAKTTFDRLIATYAVGGVTVDEVKAKFPEYAAAVELAGQKSGEAATGVDKVGGAAQNAAEAADKMKEAFDRLFGIAMGSDQAMLAYRQGLIDLNKELTTGKRTLDTTTQAGLDNAKGVLEQVNHIKALRQTNIDNNTSIKDADAAYLSQINSMRANMLQLGYTQTEVDALLGKYKAIPGEVSTPVSAPGIGTATQQANDFNFAVRNVPPSKTVPFWATTAEAKAAVEALRLKIAEIKSKHVYITGSVRWESDGDLKVPGGTLTKDRWGGVHEGGYTKAAQGVLRDAAMFGPRSPGRYMFAEPETGGELFAPKYGNLARTRSMVGHAIENWWGGWRNFVPSTAGAAAAPAPSQVSPAQVAAAVRAALAGMSVQLDGRAVGAIQGREANIYSRSGV